MTACTQPLALPQGASLDLLLRIPRTFADGFFAGWALASQIRGEPGSAFAANLTPEWIDPGDTRILRLRNAAPTTAWPVGDAWFDVRFTGPGGEAIYTRAQLIYITRSITGDTP